MSEQKKILQISCALLDATEVREETLAAYEQVNISCALMLQSSETQALFSRHAVSVNSAGTLTVPKGCKTGIINGSKLFTAADRAQGPAGLLVNGSLCLTPDAGEALCSYSFITVNGSLLCPDTLQGMTAGIMVNGHTRYYSGEAELIDHALDIDPFFILKARQNALYYATGIVRMVEEGLALASLREKGVRIQAEKAVVRAGYLADAAEILEGDIKTLIIVPEDCAYVKDAASLTTLLKRYGRRLFLHFNLRLTGEDCEALESLEYLEVRGEVSLPDTLEELFLQKCKKFQNLKVVKPKTGAYIEDVAEALVTRQLLEQSADGLYISDCAIVRFDEDIPAGLIGRVRALEDCACVICSREQRALLQTVAEDVARFEESGSEAGEEKDQRIVKVNAASYTL